MKKMKELLISALCLSMAFITACGGNTTSGGQENSGGNSFISGPAEENEISFILNAETVLMDKGEKALLDFSLRIDGIPVDISNVSFYSKEETIASIDSRGEITAVSYGETQVVAEYNEQTLEATVIVDRFVKVDINEKTTGVLLGGSRQLTANVRYGGEIIEDATLEWSSSNSQVISVSNNGLITGHAKGSADITVTCGDVTDTVTVYVEEETTAQNVNSFDEEYINIFGRSYLENNQLMLHHAANAIELGIIGSSITVNLSTTATSYMRVWIDGKELAERIIVTPGVKEYVITEELEAGYHRVRIVKATERQNAIWTVSSFSAEKFATVSEKSDLKIEFIGDSITAGYGSLGSTGESWSVDNSDSTRSYAYLTAQKLNADYSVVAESGICAKAYMWVQDTNMISLYPQIALGVAAHNFDYDSDIIVLNLGTNDATYLSPQYGGPAYGEQFPADYRALLELVREKNPTAHIICLYGMMGTDSTISNGIVTAIKAMDDENIVYNPFRVEANTNGAAGHPNSKSQMDWSDALVRYIELYNQQ